jgi:hypothetical protein
MILLDKVKRFIFVYVQERYHTANSTARTLDGDRTLSNNYNRLLASFCLPSFHACLHAYLSAFPFSPRRCLLSPMPALVTMLGLIPHRLLGLLTLRTAQLQPLHGLERRNVARVPRFDARDAVHLRLGAFFARAVAARDCDGTASSPPLPSINRPYNRHDPAYLMPRTSEATLSHQPVFARDSRAARPIMKRAPARARAHTHA